MENTISRMKTEVTDHGLVTFKDKRKVTKTNEVYYKSEITYPRTGRKTTEGRI